MTRSADENAFELAGLEFAVEHRSLGGADGGPTLRVRDAGGRELLRFDCFRVTPHFHVDPSGRDDVTLLGAVADPVTAVFERLRPGLGELLDEAGWPDAMDSPWSTAALSEHLDRVEAALRNPRVDLDHLDVAVLKTRRSEKWETYPSEILPAWVAEMDFPLAEPIRSVLQRAVDRWDFGYPINLRDTGLREAFADRMQALHGWEVDPARVVILSDVVQGLYLGLLGYSEPGDGAVVQTPIYPPFLSAVTETKRRLVENRLVPGPERFEMDLDALAAAADERTRTLLLCNPHNPTGRVFTREELSGLAELACERDWVVVVDEIHQDLVFDGHEHLPFATLSPEVAARTVTLHSATKAFNIPGLRCAVAHFGTQELQSRFEHAVPRHVRGGIGLPGLYATIAAWRHAGPWLADVRGYLAANRDFTMRVLAQEIPEIVCRPPESTYLAWLDCSALDLDQRPAHWFYEKARVALSDGSLFGPGWDAHARINFATSRAILTEVLEKLAKALRS